MFAFHPALYEYVHNTYGALLYGQRELVSVHIVFDGWEGQQPSLGWYSAVIRRFFQPLQQFTFLFFTDDAERLHDSVSVYSLDISDLDHYVVKDSQSQSASLLLMTLCRHHVASNSDLSFWGAYLDTKQPGGGHVVFPSQYARQRGMDALPYVDWHVVDADMDTSTEAAPTARGELDEAEIKRRWHTLPAGSPPAIQSQEELDRVAPQYISPVLFGDLGSMMYQLAAGHALAKERGLPCIVGWTDSTKLNKRLAGTTSLNGDSSELTLGNIFPSIQIKNFQPVDAARVSSFNQLIATDFQPFSETAGGRGYELKGHFHNLQCLFRDYYHKIDDEVITVFISIFALLLSHKIIF